MLALAAWISVLVSMKYGVHIKFLSCIKNSSKTWNIVVKFAYIVSRIEVKFQSFKT